jgi:hypothetical protein
MRDGWKPAIETGPFHKILFPVSGTALIRPIKAFFNGFFQVFGCFIVDVGKNKDYQPFNLDMIYNLF